MERAYRSGEPETARDAGAEVRFGAGRGHIDAAVDQGVDERANDFGAVENFSAPAADVSSEPIELASSGSMSRDAWW